MAASNKIKLASIDPELARRMDRALKILFYHDPRRGNGADILWRRMPANEKAIKNVTRKDISKIPGFSRCLDRRRHRISDAINYGNFLFQISSRVKIRSVFDTSRKRGLPATSDDNWKKLELDIISSVKHPESSRVVLEIRKRDPLSGPLWCFVSLSIGREGPAGYRSSK